MTKKIFLNIGIGLVVLLIIGTVVLTLSLDKIIKQGVEAVGPRITKVSIQLDDVHIGLLTGTARVKGLVIGNPEGYKAANAISVDTAAVGLNVFSLLSDKIVIRSVLIKAPEITFEGGLGGNNLSQISENVDESTKAGTAASTNTTAGKSAKKIELDDFLMTDAKVHVSLTGMGGKETTIVLPDIHLTDLGKGSNGLATTDLTRAVLDAITSATIKAVSDTASKLGKDVSTEAGKAAADSVNKIKNGLGGLLGK